MDKSSLFLGATSAVLALGAALAFAGEDPTTHPAPYPLSKVRPVHPRIWFNTENVELLRLRWNDPTYAEIVNKYRRESDALSLALEGLATNDASKCSQAAATAAYAYKPEGEKDAGYVDSISLVFDWCYPYLDAGEKADLISKIRFLRREHLDHPGTGVRSFFRWHESFLKSSFAYIASVLAIEGEPGVTSELREAQNVLQNLQELGDEVRGDGGFQSYLYQGNFQTLPFLMWSYATDMDFAAQSSFTRNLTRWAVHKLSPTRAGFSRGPGDDAAFEAGYTKHALSAGGLFLLASHFNDPLAQWLGNRLVRDFGQTLHWPSEGPSFLSLVHYDPDLTDIGPASAGMPLTAFFDKSGMVASRSSWGVGPDVIYAWFYNGPAEEHSGEGQNHFTVWRGNDPLIMRGGNFLGSPSVYQERYFRTTISANTVLFSPAGSNSPDQDGGQSGRFSDPALTAAMYPVAERLGSWPGQHRYRGEIIHYEDTHHHTIVSGDAALAYDPDHVNSYIRDFVHIKPDVFLVRDRFDAINVATIRSLIHSRGKPAYSGPQQIIQGSTNAGIIESTGNHFEIRNGVSQADVTVLWPPNPTLRFVGGPDYESYVDGYNADPYNDCADWLKNHWELPLRAALIEGQWRTEIEVTSGIANRNLVMAIFVSETNFAEIPRYTTRIEGHDLIVTVSSDQSTRVVVFPENDVPSVYSARRPSSGRRLTPNLNSLDSGNGIVGLLGGHGVSSDCWLSVRWPFLYLQ